MKNVFIGSEMMICRCRIIVSVSLIQHSILCLFLCLNIDAKRTLSLCIKCVRTIVDTAHFE